MKRLIVPLAFMLCLFSCTPTGEDPPDTPTNKPFCLYSYSYEVTADKLFDAALTVTKKTHAGKILHIADNPSYLKYTEHIIASDTTTSILLPGIAVVPAMSQGNKYPITFTTKIFYNDSLVKTVTKTEYDGGTHDGYIFGPLYPVNWYLCF